MKEEGDEEVEVRRWGWGGVVWELAGNSKPGGREEIVRNEVMIYGGTIGVLWVYGFMLQDFMGS